MNQTQSSTLPAYIECTNPRISKWAIRYAITPTASTSETSTPISEASAATPVSEASAATPVSEASAATPVSEASAATPVSEASAAYTYYEQIFYHHPTDDEILSTITAHINRQTDTAILTGFSYQGTHVWLSTENQLNYRSAYDLARQTGGQTLPVRFKLGTDTAPVYHTFSTIDALADFIRQMHTHIRTTIEAGWQEKDSIDLSRYHTA